MVINSYCESEPNRLGGLTPIRRDFGAVSVQHRVTALAQAVFDYATLFPPGRGAAFGTADDGPGTSRFHRRAAVAEYRADQRADHGTADRSGARFLLDLRGDLFALSEIVLVLTHVDPGGIDDGLLQALAATGRCQQYGQQRGNYYSVFHGFQIPVQLKKSAPVSCKGRRMERNLKK